MFAKDGYIFFYEEEPFTNFTRCTIEWGNEVFSSSEQMFMYRKALEFEDIETARLILSTDSPSRARSYGRKVKGFNVEHWDKMSYRIMEECVEEKFFQNPQLFHELFKWKDGMFVEASPIDRKWGIGFNKDTALQNKNRWGMNLLGKILTELRDRVMLKSGGGY